MIKNTVVEMPNYSCSSLTNNENIESFKRQDVFTISWTREELFEYYRSRTIPDRQSLNSSNKSDNKTNNKSDNKGSFFHA